MKMTHELTLEENKAKDFKYPSFFAEEWLENALKELDLGKMSPEKRAVVEMRLLQDVQIILHREEEKLSFAKEYAKEIEQGKVKAEQKLAEAEKNGYKLLVRSFLKVNYSKQQIADLQDWTIEYVEELISELEADKDK